MRPGIAVSAIGHVGAVLMTLIAWPQRALPNSDTTVVPVEVVTIGDVSNVRALTDAAEDQSQANTQADAPPIEQQRQAEAATAPAPQPSTRPPPRNELDLNALGDLLMDKQRPPGNRRNQQVANAQQSDHSRRGVGLGTAEMARLQDYVRARADDHIGRCWRVPLDSANPERLHVVVAFDLDRTAHIRGQPRVVTPSGVVIDPVLRAAVNSALSAVRACDPYPFADDPLTADHYEAWSQITYNFDPANFRGH
ncbi:MAG: hypothetical protein AB7L65_01850 [Hyphomonadaceae bacterium]